MMSPQKLIDEQTQAALFIINSVLFHSRNKNTVLYEGLEPPLSSLYNTMANPITASYWNMQIYMEIQSIKQK